MITKNEFIRVTRGQHNEIRDFHGIKIAKVTFRPNNAWRVVSENTTFDEAAEDNLDIPSFYYRDELWNYVKTLLI